MKKKIAFFDSIWEKGKKRGQIANRKIIGERAFSDNAEPGPRLKRNIIYTSVKQCSALFRARVSNLCCVSTFQLCFVHGY